VDRLASPFLDIDSRQDPVARGQVKLIAESLGRGRWRLPGRRTSRSGWAEWNAQLARRPCAASGSGDHGEIGDLAAFGSNRLGSADHLRPDRSRGPWASVNFITAHDGFTLMRLMVSYDAKAQRGEWRGRPGRARRQPDLELRRRR
jgi:isoamylase